MPDYDKDEETKRACANYLGIDPKLINKVEHPTDGGGHFTGLRVIIFISAERTHAREFVDYWKDRKPEPVSVST